MWYFFPRRFQRWSLWELGRMGETHCDRRVSGSHMLRNGTPRVCAFKCLCILICQTPLLTKGECFRIFSLSPAAVWTEGTFSLSELLQQMLCLWGLCADTRVSERRFEGGSVEAQASKNSNRSVGKKSLVSIDSSGEVDHRDWLSHGSRGGRSKWLRQQQEKTWRRSYRKWMRTLESKLIWIHCVWSLISRASRSLADVCDLPLN